MDPIQSSDRGYLKERAGGVDKPRGLDNAELQHESKGSLVADRRPIPAVTVTLDSPQPDLVTYSRDGRLAGAAKPEARAGQAAEPNRVGDDSKVQLNSRVGTSSGSETLVVGDGAKVRLNERVGTDTGSDRIQVGNEATLRLKTRTAADPSSGTLIVEDRTAASIKERPVAERASDASARAPAVERRENRKPEEGQEDPRKGVPGRGPLSTEAGGRATPERLENFDARLEMIRQLAAGGLPKFDPRQPIAKKEKEPAASNRDKRQSMAASEESSQTGATARSLASNDREDAGELPPR